jgi:hypothetical protein
MRNAENLLSELQRHQTETRQAIYETEEELFQLENAQTVMRPGSAVGQVLQRWVEEPR